MTHGCQITDSTITNRVYSLPITIPICKSIEQLTNINTTSSDQHRDLHNSNETKDKRDHETFFLWLSTHSLFVYKCVSIICISTGMIADKAVNCKQAYELGCMSANLMIDMNFAEIRLKRNDKVKTIASMTNTVSILKELVTMKSSVLFNRITSILRDSSDMGLFLSYEFAPEQTSLFQEVLKIKSQKSALAQLLQSKAPLQSKLPNDAMYIVDEGYLLHVVIWPPNPTYGKIYDSYVSYVVRPYGFETIVVFGGYDSAMSTKVSEQKRGATKSPSRDKMIDESMKADTSQSAFLNNNNHKSKLIIMLVYKLNDKNSKTRQTIADADRLKVETASLETRYSYPIVVITTDTDILVMLTSLAPACSDMYMLCSTNPTSLYNITLIQEAVGNKKQNLLFAHSVTGCATTPALFCLGKKKAINLLDQYNNYNSLDVFIS